MTLSGSRRLISRATARPRTAPPSASTADPVAEALAAPEPRFGDRHRADIGLDDDGPEVRERGAHVAEIEGDAEGARDLLRGVDELADADPDRKRPAAWEMVSREPMGDAGEGAKEVGPRLPALRRVEHMLPEDGWLRLAGSLSTPQFSRTGPCTGRAKAA